MRSFSFICLVALIAALGLTLVAAGYDPTNDPVPGPNPSTIPGQPLSPFDEPIETVGPEILIEAQPIENIVYKKAILMVENNCKLRNQFRGTRAFIHLESGYFPELYTKLVNGLPRIKFYQLDEDFKNATVDPETLTSEEMLTVLRNISKNPDYYAPKGIVTEVLISKETKQEDILKLLERFNIGKTMDFDLSKRPDIHETSEDRSDGRKFEHDDVLRELNPQHDSALPDESYDYDFEMDLREGLIAKDDPRYIARMKEDAEKAEQLKASIAAEKEKSENKRDEL